MKYRGAKRDGEEFSEIPKSESDRVVAAGS